MERQVPANVRKAIKEAWLAQPEPRELPINCNGYDGTFVVSENKECFIRNAAGLAIKPTQFERDSGKATAKDWQRSIRVPGGCAWCQMYITRSRLALDQQQPRMASVGSWLGPKGPTPTLIDLADRLQDAMSSFVPETHG
jgi:hypothetical protein